MNSFPASPVPETGADADLRRFHQLARQIVQSDAIDSLLDALAAHLNVSSLHISAPGSPGEGAAARDDTLSVALNYRDWHLGELRATPGANTDRAVTTARLEFFSPLVALHLILSTRLEDQGAGLSLHERRTHDTISRDLRDERDRLEAVLDATNDAILLVDAHDTLVMATPQFESFTGISRYDILGLPIEQLAQHDHDQPGLPPAITNVISALAGNYTESLGGEFELFEPQRRILVWYSLPVYVRSGTLLGRIFAFRDSTRERELDRMKTDFISLVSHELRTPLTSVKGFSDLLMESGAEHLDPESREYLGIIGFNADRLIALINDIIDITRIDSDRIELRPEMCLIADVIEQSVTAFAPMLSQRGHTLSIDVPPDVPPVWADRNRLVQIMTNLLGNAIKYTLEPGSIAIDVCVAHATGDLPSAAPRGQIFPCLVVNVQDSGIGIAPGDSEQVFQRFYRVESNANRGIGGTGLGLAIVKSLVELQGGRVWFESSPQHGSTFSFSVPVARESHLEGY